MINQMRTEACSGAIDDMAHVVTQDCLADCLTKANAKPDNLLKAVNTSVLPNLDKHPPFRKLMQHRHKAYGMTEYEQDLWRLRENMFIAWIATYMTEANTQTLFWGLPIQRSMECYFTTGYAC